ncbi:xanthine dehydrogenase accessory protein XdhC, partial [Burkholderia sp. Cy-647]|nr:xanthine dehydrogenase accessory protein XdhC [Burkholderia sp. Cy-647]
PAIAVAVCAELLQARNGAARAWRKTAATDPAALSGVLLLGDI